MDGGFTGTVRLPSAEARETAIRDIELALRSALNSALVSQAQTGFPFLPGMERFSFDIADTSRVATGSSTITILGTGTFRAIAAKASSLAQALAEENVRDYRSEPVLLRDIARLTFSPLLGDGEYNASTRDLSIHVTGSSTFEWTFDEEKLKGKLAGLSEHTYSAVFQEFSAIVRAEATLTPFWTSTFPEDPARIRIERVVDKP